MTDLSVNKRWDRMTRWRNTVPLRTPPGADVRFQAGVDSVR